MRGGVVQVQNLKTKQFLVVDHHKGNMDLPSLEEALKHIPAANRHRLDEKLEDRRSRVRIAKGLRGWKTLAQFLPGIHNDIDGIQYDNQTLELQK